MDKEKEVVCSQVHASHVEEWGINPSSALRMEKRKGHT